jgi:hypothetical protein
MEGKKSLLKLISKDIRDLEGRGVTRATLRAIQRKRRDAVSWTQPLGYASFITDRRLPEWWRVRIGQGSHLWRRIICQHSQAILRSSTSSLHCYILWMSNSNRTANFIRLWQFPKETSIDDSC